MQNIIEIKTVSNDVSNILTKQTLKSGLNNTKWKYNVQPKLYCRTDIEVQYQACVLHDLVH